MARVVAQAVRAKRVRVKSGDPGSGAERAWGVEIVDGLEVTPATAAGPLVFSPDGRLLALPGDGEVRVWNVAERRLAGSYPLKDPGRGLAFSADGRTLRYLSGIGSVVSLDVSGLPAPAGEGQVAAFSGNGRVAAKEVGDAIELTDAESRRTLGRIAAAGDLAFDATGRLLAVAGDPVTVWEVASGRQVTSIEAGGDVPAVALSPDGGTLATARGTLLETWDVRSGRRIKAYEGVGDLALAFSPDGMTLAAGTRLLDLRTGQVTPLDLAARASGGAAATALAFSPDGDRLAFGLEGGRVLLWGVHERAPHRHDQDRQRPRGRGAVLAGRRPDGDRRGPYVAVGRQDAARGRPGRVVGGGAGVQPGRHPAARRGAGRLRTRVPRRSRADGAGGVRARGRFADQGGVGPAHPGGRLPRGLLTTTPGHAPPPGTRHHPRPRATARHAPPRPVRRRRGGAASAYSLRISLSTLP
ncbi:hypothetical protein [Nonomuraea salmonea]|uniref:WD40 repeat domain-containing protein n=1 Tax=Nonomuraea salmonea TaxID=46181 RepID=UPI0031EDA8DF